MNSSAIFKLLFLIVIGGCVSRDLESLPAITEGHQLTMVVEIAAGSAEKIEYNSEKKAFLPDSVQGKVRIVDFLPYPVNYGFIPSTLQSKAKGGDGDPLDVMLIGQSLPAGSVLKVIPVGVLRLKDNGEADDKILAIPADPSQRLIAATDFATLTMNYPAILTLLNDWFVNYKGQGVTTSDGWGDEAEAWRLVIDNAKNPKK